MQKLNREIVCSGFITLPVCNLGESSYLYIQIQKGLFFIPKIADSSKKNGLLSLYIFNLDFQVSKKLNREDKKKRHGDKNV